MLLRDVPLRTIARTGCSTLGMSFALVAAAHLSRVTPHNIADCVRAVCGWTEWAHFERRRT